MGPGDEPRGDGELVVHYLFHLRYSRRMVSDWGIIAVYIMASRRHGTLYIGVTGNLARRTYEHREGLIVGFTRTYGCKKLVWYQSFERMTNAIRREKTMKEWPREWKCNLIERDNPNWDDLFGAWDRPLLVAPTPRHPGTCSRDP